MNRENPIIHAFSEEHVVRLTGLTRGQLRAWDKRGFFKPEYAYENRKAPYSRVYSFEDIVGLRTIAVLIKNYRISHSELRRVATELEERGYKKWSAIKLYIVKKQVHFRQPNSSNVEGVWDGQYAMLPVIDVIEDVEQRIHQLRQRDKDKVGQIDRRKFVVRNASVISGTRIPTAAIKRFKEAGYSVEAIIDEYPSLTPEDVHAALFHEEMLVKSA